MPSAEAEKDYASYILVATLGELQVRKWFVNVGSDWPPLIDAYARYDQEGEKKIDVYTIPHEITATAMAAGYSMVSGEIGLVGVHTNVGTANTLSNMVNVYTERIPLFVLAGTSPLTEGELYGGRTIPANYGQDSFDQGGLLRQYVKWDFLIKSAANIPAVLERARKVALSPPQGPVYIMAPRDLLLTKTEAKVPKGAVRRATPSPPAPDPTSVDKAASFLVKSSNPLIITGFLGRNPSSVTSLVETAELLGAGVVEFPRHRMNFPTNHNLHLGFNVQRHIAQADVILAIETPLPWIPSGAKPIDSAKVIQVDVDPTYTEFPLIGYGVDVSITSDGQLFLKALNARISKLLEDRGDGKRLARERYAKVVEQHKVLGRETANRISEVRNSRPISMSWLSKVIGDVRDQGTIVVTSYDLDQRMLDFTLPGTFYSAPTGGALGFELGAALGASLANGKEVICCVGDGAFLYGMPEAFFWVSKHYRLPVLTVIFNNAGYQTFKVSPSEAFYAMGWAPRVGRYIGVDIDPPLDYSAISTAAGLYGSRVEDPSELRGELDRALDKVRTTKVGAVVDVICEKSRPMYT